MIDEAMNCLFHLRGKRCITNVTSRCRRGTAPPQCLARTDRIQAYGLVVVGLGERGSDKNGHVSWLCMCRDVP